LATVCRDECLLTGLYENHLKAALSTAPVAELLVADVDNAITGIARSVSTKNRYRKLVRDTLGFAVRASYCIENVAVKSRPWGHKVPEVEGFASRISSALAFLHEEDPDAAALMAVAAASKVPLDRLLTLHWHEIDYEAACLRCDDYDEADDEEPENGPALGSNANYILACRFLRDEFGWTYYVFPEKDGNGANMPFKAVKRALVKAGFPDEFSLYSFEGLHRSEAVQAGVYNFARSIDSITW
jgi:hypothetical protein